MSKFIALDIETNGLNFLSDKIMCVGFSNGWFLDEEYKLTTQTKINTLKDQNTVIVMHNGSFDCKFLWSNGIEIENEFDTMVAAYLLTDRPGKLSLDALASYYLGIPSWKDDIKGGEIFKNPDLMRLYCIKDCQITAKLAEILEEKLIKEGKLDFFYKLMKARRMLTRAEYRGVTLDQEKTRKLIAVLDAEHREQLAELNARGTEFTAAYPKKSKAGFNWNSPAQIKWLLKDALGLNTVNPLTGKESADRLVLELNERKHPLIPYILKMRKTAKLQTTLEGYLEVVKPETKALHPNFNLSNTITGRLSSSGDLNIQQVDRSHRVRSLFIARPGYKLVIGDLAQIEPRLAAHYSKDPILCAMFEREEDLYGTIAVQLLGADCAPNEVKDKYPEKRKVAKVIGLSVLYGIGVHKLCSTIQNAGGISSFTISDARKVIDDYFEKFSGLKVLQSGVHHRITQLGYITNSEGRKVDVSEDKVHRDGVNSLLQSSASDFMLFKNVDFEATTAKQFDAHLLMLVHDEAIYEVPELQAEAFAAKLKEHMETATFKVPIKFEVFVGDNWGEKE